MKISIVVALAFLAIGADAAVSFTTPGTATITATNYNEGGTAAAYTVVATTDQSGETVTFAISAQTVTGAFTITSGGAVTPASATSTDHEQVASHVITVTGVDSAATSTVTITVPIADVNDNTPTFNSGSMTASVVDAAVATTPLGTFAANDLDLTAPSNTLTYSIASGDSGAIFAYSAAGALTVAAAKTTAAATTPCYTLVLQAVDGGTPALTGSSTLVVTVGSSSCSSAAAALVGSLLLAIVGMLASQLQ